MRWFAKGSTYVPQAWEKNTTILALGPLSENNWKGTWISGVSIIKIAWTSFYALESSVFRITFNTSFPIYWGKVYQKYTNIYTYLLYTLLFAYIYTLTPGHFDRLIETSGWPTAMHHQLWLKIWHFFNKKNVR